MSDNDGIDDALRGATQVAAGMIARAAEIRAREQEAGARQREHQLEVAGHQAEQHADRGTAELQAARARLQLVREPAWWHTATASDIAHSWTIANTLPGDDAISAARTINREVAARYGVATADHPDPDGLQAAIEQAAADRQQAVRESGLAATERAQARGHDGAAKTARQDAAQARHASTQAVVDRDPDGANAHTVEAEDAEAGAVGLGRNAERSYDSAEQREARNRGYEACGNPRAAEARRIADSAEGVPAIYATSSRSRSRRRARRPAPPGPRTPRRDRGR